MASSSSSSSSSFILHLLRLLLCSSIIFSVSGVGQEGYISAVVFQKGLEFVKDILVEKATEALTPLLLPDVQKSVKIPLVGTVNMAATNITIYGVNVSSSTVRSGGVGIDIVASGATASMSMDWSYSYSTWLIKISDEGSASVQAEGMEIGLAMTLENLNGSLDLTVMKCSCYIKDLVMTVDGGASWFYQGFVNAFQDHITSAVETAITKKLTEEASKLDSLLQTVPKKIDVGKGAVLNVTFIDDPIFSNSSVEFDISGLFISSDETPAPSHSNLSHYCENSIKMFLFSLDVTVLNSAFNVYFKAGLMHWMVDKISGVSILNTASWKYIVPVLYFEYPDDDMLLNLSLASPPVVQISSRSIGVTIDLELTVLVLDGDDAIPVACLALVGHVSGVLDIFGNDLFGDAELDEFSLTVKWSSIENLSIPLIQTKIQFLLNTELLPYVNGHLRQGFSLPIVHGVALQNASILTTSSVFALCSDATFESASGIIDTWL